MSLEIRTVTKSNNVDFAIGDEWGAAFQEQYELFDPTKNRVLFRTTDRVEILRLAWALLQPEIARA